ncbi:MAG: hypothetical protein AOA66_0775 [Candidatus Bathyarchaeota archaeon BA2]|nr:MAG: hypothetical protein AOA66_0775 [Candidatus Bathyarchaeota archaeon BA2]
MGGTCNKAMIYNCEIAFYGSRSLVTVWSNVVVRNVTYIMRVHEITTDKLLKNVDSDNWEFYGWSSECTAKVFRQHEFDCHVQDKDGNAINGVSVVGEYTSPHGIAFSVTTDVNGNIATQTVDRSWYEQATGNTENLKTPLKVTYKKAGYQTTVKYYPLDQKTVDRVVMHKAVAVFNNFGSPVVNLKRANPENKNVMVL